MRDERRTTQRIPVPLTFHWKRGKKQIDARVADINGGGLFLETSEQIKPGQVMDLVVDLPSGPISFLAVSRNCVARGIGVSIFSMDPKDKARWSRYYGLAVGSAH